MEEEFFIMWTVADMMENGRKTRCMAMEHSIILMEQ